MTFQDLLLAAIQRSEIPLRFEPGAEEAVANGGLPLATLRRHSKHTQIIFLTIRLS